MVNFLEPTWCHWGLPCGTCSRARERPIAQSLKLAGAPEPRLLRNADFLHGLPNLSPHERERVESANRIYLLAVLLLEPIFRCDAILSIENPSRSWLWAALADLVKSTYPDPTCLVRRKFFSMENVEFDHCMHGGGRPKETRLRCTPDVFNSLEGMCDNPFDHLPWTLTQQDGSWHFAIGGEAEYPLVLARRMVQCAVQQIPAHLLADTSKAFRLDTLAATMQQTKRHAQLIPEFHHVESTQLPPKDRAFKPLDVFDPPEAGVEDEGHNDNSDNHDCHPKKHKRTHLKKFGIYHTPEQHLATRAPGIQ